MRCLALPNDLLGYSASQPVAYSRAPQWAVLFCLLSPLHSQQGDQGVASINLALTTLTEWSTKSKKTNSVVCIHWHELMPVNPP